MSDDRRLRERLTALSASGISGAEGRRIRAPGASALLARVLAEIDGTVMPRLIRLAPDATRFVVLEVANRRLLRITAGSGDPALSALTGTEFTNDPGKDGAAVSALFRALVADADGLTLRAEPLEHQLDPEKAGLSARRMAQLLELPAPAPPESTAEMADAFLGRIDAMAWMMISGDSTESAGDDAVLEGLAGMLDDLPPPDPADWSFLALSGAGMAHGMTILADLKDLRLVVAVSADRLGAVADAWRAVVVPAPTLTGQ